MKSKKDLEATIKEKVSPLLEETMEKQLGITIPKLESDISDKLKNPQLNIYVSLELPFAEAKNVFKTEFIKRELRFQQGNVSQLAKILGLDRRSIHRVIKKFEIDIENLRGHEESREKDKETEIHQTIRSTLEQYKSILHPLKMEKMYQEIGTLSKNIAKFIPNEEWTWKEAEREFEKQFLGKILEANDWKVSRAAGKLQIRVETLHRKIKQLGLRE